MLALTASRSFALHVLSAGLGVLGGTIAAVTLITGCAKETSAPSVTTRTATTFQRLPVGLRGRPRDMENARTLASTAGASLLGFFDRSGRSGSPLAPFDNGLADGDRPLEMNGLCPPDMASIDDRLCVDKYEASLVEILPSGDERPWSPYAPVEGHTVRAVSEAGVVPQAYISELQAQDACARSGKRLCKPAEWRRACMGPQHTTYGYGEANQPGRCNDDGRSPVVATYGATTDLGDRSQWNWDHMNDPSLNQLDRTLAKTGSHPGCTNGYGVYDMVGNLHEWVADPNGTFQGGYYQDTHLNGDGCGYTTKAHAAWYHDYSTGFRCCADPAQ
jgi:hypothetical protein